MHVGHGADVGVCVVCVVVVPHTWGRLLPATTGRGSTGSSSMSDITSKAFVEGDVDGEREGGVWEDDGGGFFFLFLSFLYIREGFIKKGDEEGIKRHEARKCTTHHLRFGGGGGRGGLLILQLLGVDDVVVVIVVGVGM